MQILEQCLRLYTSTKKLDEVVQFYEKLQNTRCERRLLIAESGIVVAKVGGMLILAKNDPFPDHISAIQAIFYVDRLDEIVAWCAANGAEILKAPHAVTAGGNATVRNPDGLLAEYFEAMPHG